MTGSEIENSAIKTAYLSLEISKPLSTVGILFSVRYVLLNGKLVFHFVCNCMCVFDMKNTEQQMDILVCLFPV